MSFYYRRKLRKIGKALLEGSEKVHLYRGDVLAREALNEQLELADKVRAAVKDRTREITEVDALRRDYDKLRIAHELSRLGVTSDFSVLLQRTLDVARIQGWNFPETCDVGVKVVRAEGPLLVIYARIDDVGTEAQVTPATTRADLAATVDALVQRWLEARGTRRC
jgi:hypothetical protein